MPIAKSRANIYLPERVVFQNQLGDLRERSQRISELAGFIAENAADVKSKASRLVV